MVGKRRVGWTWAVKEALPKGRESTIGSAVTAGSKGKPCYRLLPIVVCFVFTHTCVTVVSWAPATLYSLLPILQNLPIPCGAQYRCRDTHVVRSCSWYLFVTLISQDCNEREESVGGKAGNKGCGYSPTTKSNSGNGLQVDYGVAKREGEVWEMMPV